MNNTVIIGRLTRDPEIRYTAEGMPVASFTVAVDRMTSGKKETDFPRCVAMGKRAEFAEKWLFKGQMVAVCGSIRTGSYETNEGRRVYTTDILASKIQPLEWKYETNEGRKVYTTDTIPSDIQPLE